MSNTAIKNVSLDVLALPPPYSGFLMPGQSAVVSDTPAQIQAALGGSPQVTRALSFVVLPANQPLTSHGLANLDETIATPAAAANLNVRTTRFDVAGGAGNATCTVAPGLYSGQQKKFYVLSATGSALVSVVPNQMSEGRQALKLQGIGAWATLEWQSLGVTGVAPSGAGWKISEYGGGVSGGVTLV